MKLAEKLNDLRLKFPECQTLAFADISTGMILCTSAEDHVLQEQLDALCGTAVEMLNGDTATRLGKAIPASDDSAIYQAITVDVDEVGIFLKSTINPADALCCVCSPTIDLGSFIRDACENLTQFGLDA